MDTITQNCCVRFNKTLNYPDDGARGGAYGYGSPWLKIFGKKL
jgi:hypothetical protein